jgi:flagellar protein FlaF
VGFSVSGSAAILFVGFIVAAGIAIPPLIGSFGSLASAQDEQIDRGVDAMNTGIEITNATYDSETGTLEINVTNDGSTTLSVNDTSVLVDGEIPARSDVTTDIEGDGAVELWLPGETLTITVENVDSEPNRVKVVTENAVSETVADGDIEVVGP